MSLSYVVPRSPSRDNGLGLSLGLLDTDTDLDMFIEHHMKQAQPQGHTSPTSLSSVSEPNETLTGPSSIVTASGTDEDLDTDWLQTVDPLLLDSLDCATLPDVLLSLDKAEPQQQPQQQPQQHRHATSEGMGVVVVDNNDKAVVETHSSVVGRRRPSTRAAAKLVKAEAEAEAEVEIAAGSTPGNSCSTIAAATSTTATETAAETSTTTTTVAATSTATTTTRAKRCKKVQLVQEDDEDDDDYHIKPEELAQQDHDDEDEDEYTAKRFKTTTSRRHRSINNTSPALSSSSHSASCTTKDPNHNARMAKLNRERKKAYVHNLEEKLAGLEKQASLAKSREEKLVAELSTAQTQIQQLQAALKSAPQLAAVFQALGQTTVTFNTPQEANSLSRKNLVVPFQVNLVLPSA